MIRCVLISTDITLGTMSAVFAHKNIEQLFTKNKTTQSELVTYFYQTPSVLELGLFTCLKIPKTVFGITKLMITLEAILDIHRIVTGNMYFYSLFQGIVWKIALIFS